MKAKWCVAAFLLLALCSVGQLYAQESNKLSAEFNAFEKTKAKAEKGDAESQLALGWLYEQGIGTQKNISEAVKWYRKSADQNNALAQTTLGVCYESGKGVEIDFVQAFKLYRKSALQGEPTGEFSLSALYFAGKGVAKNNIEAYKWANLASAGGMVRARELLALLEQQMTPEQIAEAQRLTREFKPGDVNSESPTSSGTGFFITEDGYLISNCHVVKDAAKVRLLTGAGMVDAKVVQVDAANDLALLKAEGRFVPLPIAANRSMQLGSTVATVGFPDPGLQGFSPKLAKGEIAGLAGAADDPRYFQISVPVQPGNSGGALVDDKGNVVGIVSAKLNAAAALAESGALPENVNYAIKSSFLLGFLESVPVVSIKLKPPNTKDEKFEDVVKSAQDAAALVLVY